MRFTTLGRMLTGRADGRRRPRRRPRSRPLAVVAVEPRVLPAVTIAIDYTYDAHNFFNTQAKRDVLQQAANVVASTLNDSLTAITPSGGNTWNAQFPDPVTKAVRSIPNLVVPANTIIIYVGGGNLGAASEAGLGSTGGYTASSSTGDQSWFDTIRARGQSGALSATPTDYGTWGGSITFDDSGATPWYFNSSITGISVTQTDFMSVAEHEIGHVLGIGTAPSWDANISGSSFVGANARAAYGGPVPLNATTDHWGASVVYGGSPALMDPVLTNGTRVEWTGLDFAALKDIGWQVQVQTPVVQFSTALYSGLETSGGVVVTVNRVSGAGAFSIRYSTSDGSAKAGLDYTATSGVLNFSASDVSKTFTVPVLNDAVADGAETVGLTLSSPTGATLGFTSGAVLTILDNTYRALGDFDGDNHTDQVVFRPSTSQWYVQQSTAGTLTPTPVYGASNLADIPLVGDFDGIGHAEIAVFRPSTAQWFVLGPLGAHQIVNPRNPSGAFGGTNLFDIPVPGDYDGVGRTQLAVFRPSTAQWFVLGANGITHQISNPRTPNGSFGMLNLGDIPVPGDYDGVGRTQLAVFRPSTAQWFVLGVNGVTHQISNPKTGNGSFGMTGLSDIPVPGDYDGVGRTQPAVFRPSTGQWFVLGSAGGHAINSLGGPNFLDLPAEASVASLAKLRLVGSPFSRTSAFTPSPSTTATAGSNSAPLVVVAPGDLAPLAPPKRRTDAAWLSALDQFAADSASSRV